MSCLVSHSTDKNARLGIIGRLLLSYDCRTDQNKALYWMGDGYLLLYKRLSQWKISVTIVRIGAPAAVPPELLVVYGRTSY